MARVTCAGLVVAFFSIIYTTPLFGQQRFVAERVTNPSPTIIEDYFSNYQLVNLPVLDIHRYVQSSGGAVPMEWYFPNGLRWQLVLEQYELQTAAFELTILDAKGDRRRLPNDPLTTTFRSANADQDVRLTINKSFLYGYVHHQGQDWFIEPANRFLPSLAAGVFIVYPSNGVRPIPGLHCAQTDKGRSRAGFGPRTGRSGCHEVEFAVAADYSMFEYYGSAGAILQQVQAVLNSVAGNFDNEFGSEIQFKLSELVISTCLECDPWSAGQDAVPLLESFSDWGDAGGFLRHFDIGQFWSRRNYMNQGSGGVIGMAYVGSVCGENPYHILEDFTASAGLLRVMTAHEIGHNFGCGHNYSSGDYECYANARPDFIMDPTVNISAAWTNGQLGYCEANSVSIINDFLQDNNCLLDCSDDCGIVAGLEVEFDNLLPALSLSWEGETTDSWCILMERLDRTGVDTFFTADSYLMLDNEVELCMEYRVTVATVCGDELGARQEVLLQTASDLEIELLAASPKACQITDGTYELDLEVAYTETNADGFTVWVAGIPYQQSYTESPQAIHLSNLQLPVDGRVLLQVVPNVDGGFSCGDGFLLATPDQACNLQVEETFDGCRMPMGWDFETTYPSGAKWQIGDSTRLTANFGVGQNSFDGSCMIYFDDDVLGPYPEQSGSSYILTPVYDFAGYEGIEVSLRYNFNSYYSAPHTNFTIEVFDGTNWVLVHQDQEGGDCVPSQSWNESCLLDWTADLSGYANANFQVRLGYHDGGQWAEFVAVDNVQIIGQRNTSFLPVVWSEFTAEPEKETVALSWSTEQEQNNEGFYIERSADGRAFEPLQFVAGAGDSDQPQAYFHLDTRPLSGTSYYRLRQVDVDGDQTYSEIREVYLSNGAGDWQIYPNPVGADGRVVISGLPAGDISTYLELFSVDGRLLQRYPIAANTSTTVLQLDRNNLNSGVYLLRYEDGTMKRLVL
ncbi:MAG: M12 family metallo-peptidase [Bacteroidota bacterium]